MITQKDMTRLIIEQFEHWKTAFDHDGGMSEWAASQGFEDDVVRVAVEKIAMLPLETWVTEDHDEGVGAVEALYNHVQSAVIMAFLIGWETQKQLGKPSTVL